eukprot:14850665-Ditylum_brightwellii.AAC.1
MGCFMLQCMIKTVLTPCISIPLLAKLLLSSLVVILFVVEATVAVEGGLGDSIMFHLGVEKASISPCAGL